MAPIPRNAPKINVPQPGATAHRYQPTGNAVAQISSVSSSPHSEQRGRVTFFRSNPQAEHSAGLVLTNMRNNPSTTIGADSHWPSFFWSIAIPATIPRSHDPKDRGQTSFGCGRRSRHDGAAEILAHRPQAAIRIFNGPVRMCTPPGIWFSCSYASWNLVSD